MKHILSGGAFAALVAAAVQLSAQTTPAPKASYRPARTGWGAPDIHGDYTNKDEANTPLERPRQLAGKDLKDFTDADLTQLARERSAAAEQIAGGIRPWFITDPPDGQVPPMTPQAQRREAAIALLNDARNGEGRADSPDGRSMYDRCITRGLPGSMMPAIYGN